MNEEKFIKSIISEVHDASVDDVVSSLGERPSGSRPNQKDIELYDWFSGLSESDRCKVEQIVKYSVHSSLFGLFAVLDGSRVIEDGVKQGEFSLGYKNTEGDYSLSKSGDLHNEYQHQIYSKVFVENT